MKNNLRPIKYGNEEYVALDVNDLKSFSVKLFTSRNDKIVLEYFSIYQTVFVSNLSDDTIQATKLQHFDGTIIYVPIYGKVDYHKNLNLLEIDRVFNKLCKDNAINQAFLDRLQSEYPEELL